MTTYFITRHPGAREWAKQKGIKVDEHLTHLDIDMLKAGDTLIGSLPINLAAEVCQKGAFYIHLSLNIPEHLRGLELSATQLQQYGAELECFNLQKCTTQSMQAISYVYAYAPATIQIPVNLQNQALEVILRPLAAPQETEIVIKDHKGWPDDFFKLTAGCLESDPISRHD
jgi:CRISPR-associated protein Csx16